MVLLDQIKYELGQYNAPLDDLGNALARDEKEVRINTIEGQMSVPGFWDDAKTSAALTAIMGSMPG